MSEYSVMCSRCVSTAACRCQRTQKLVGVITVDNERIEELRQILESEQNRPVTHEEAKNVGESLITVYKVLAGDREILGVARTEDKDNE